jgi:hypothetical protein
MSREGSSGGRVSPPVDRSIAVSAFIQNTNNKSMKEEKHSFSFSQNKSNLSELFTDQ